MNTQHQLYVIAGHTDGAHWGPAQFVVGLPEVRRILLNHCRDVFLGSAPAEGEVSQDPLYVMALNVINGAVTTLSAGAHFYEYGEPADSVGATVSFGLIVAALPFANHPSLVEQYA